MTLRRYSQEPNKQHGVIGSSVRKFLLWERTAYVRIPRPSNHQPISKRRSSSLINSSQLSVVSGRVVLAFAACCSCSKACNTSWGRARTAILSVRFTHRTMPSESRRNSAGRAMSAPLGPAPGCNTSYRRMTFAFGSDSKGNVYPSFCDCRLLISGGSTLMPTTRMPRDSNSESRC